MTPPSIIQVVQESRMAKTGMIYSQDVAYMSDGSRWEVPTVGNGNMWRKIGRSREELQKDFGDYFLAISAKDGHNILNGTSTAKNSNSTDTQAAG